MSKTSFNAMVLNDDWNAGKHKYEQTVKVTTDQLIKCNNWNNNN